jgi:hypothetical protein
VGGLEDHWKDIYESESNGDYNGKGTTKVANGRERLKYMVGNFDEDGKFHEDTDQIANPIHGRVYPRLKPIDEVYPKKTAETVNDVRVK